MVVKLPQIDPWISLRWRLKWTIYISTAPDNNFSRLGARDQGLLVSVHHKHTDGGLMIAEFKLSGRCALQRAKDYFTVPVATLNHVVSIFWDGHRVVEFLCASVNLVHSSINISSIEFLFPVTA